jgi:ribosome-binding protein aMBF1 (putative translation factor)
MSTKPEPSPIGDPTCHGAGRRSRECVEYRAEQQRLAPYEALARLIIKHRAQLGLTQQQLAERMGTSHSAISRMESGQHPTKPETLRRLAAALEMRLVIGFESGPEERPTRELITL